MSATQGATKGKEKDIHVSPIDETSLSVFPLIRTLTQRRWQLLACLLLVCTVAFAATAMRQPKFQAVARVEVVMDQPSIAGLNGQAANLGGDYFSTQCQLLQSRHVLAATARKLNMSGGQWAMDNEGLEALRNNVKIKPVPGSRLIDIVGISEVAPMAAAIANQITAAFIETSTDARRAAANRLIERVNQQIQRYDAEIQDKKNTVNKFRQEHLITGNDTTLATVETRIRAIEQELTVSQMKRLDLESQRLQIERALDSGQGMSEQEKTLKNINTHPRIIQLKQTLATLKNKEIQLGQIYLSGHPKLHDVRLRIADLQTQLLDQKQNLMQGLIAEITENYIAAVKQEESLSTLLNQQKELGVSLTEKHQGFTELLNDLKTHRKFRQECLARVREFKLQEGMAESPVVVIDAAQSPVKPAGLSKTRQAASILLIGILFSLAFVLSLDRLSHPTQVSQATTGKYQTVPMTMPYGMVPNWPGAYWTGPNQTNPSPQQPATQADAMRMVSQAEASALGKLQNIELGQNNYNNMAFKARCRIVHADQTSTEAAAFREMANQLIHRFGQTHQSLVITSAKEHEGKTTCACNLALGLAKTGRKVLLVDANRENPVLHKIFANSDGQTSFHEVLLDRELLEKAPQDSQVPGLTILAETGDNNANHHDNAPAIELLLHQLKDRFDWIVFDTSTTGDPLTKELLRAVSKCLLVTGQTDKDEQKRLARLIEQSGSICIGFVENAHVYQSETHQQKATS